MSEEEKALLMLSRLIEMSESKLLVERLTDARNEHLEKKKTDDKKEKKCGVYCYCGDQDWNKNKFSSPTSSSFRCESCHKSFDFTEPCKCRGQNGNKCTKVAFAAYMGCLYTCLYKCESCEKEYGVYLEQLVYKADDDGLYKFTCSCSKRLLLSELICIVEKEHMCGFEACKKMFVDL